MHKNMKATCTVPYILQCMLVNSVNKKIFHFPFHNRKCSIQYNYV